MEKGNSWSEPLRMMWSYRNHLQAVHLIKLRKRILEEIAEDMELSFDRVKELENQSMQLA